MTATIVGAQLGDEGKGGVVDLFGDATDVVVRYQGGDNAGHTVVHGGEEFQLSLVPSGAVRGHVGVLGNGCVINPRTLFDELDALRDRGIDPDVRVAERAHVILPYHRALDGIEESAKEGDDLAAGTTGRGIGPTYEDKAGRRGIRIGDLLDPETLRRRLEYVVPQKRALFEEVYEESPGEVVDLEALHDEFRTYGRRLREEDMTVDAGAYLRDRVADGATLLLEGAQGTSLDIDHGVYPYVTSSNPTAGAAATGTGLPPSTIADGEIVGVVKAYLSRVGPGPLPTELEGDLAETIRERGGEFGTVTGRPRRVGWLDVPMLRHATDRNGFTGFVLNHVDVLAGLDEIRVAHAYRLAGETRETMPTTTERWGECDPVYRRFEGWPTVDWATVATEGYTALPANARSYIEYLEDELGVPAIAVGVGPDRDLTVVQSHPLAE
ncbi:MAG: adenylosuccinate synthase [Halobacteriaceae archaeon]